jgi:hypothetical protein
VDRFEWDDRGFSDRLDLRAGRTLIRRAALLQKEHMQALSIPNPYPHKNPAPRGDYPHGRTWNLRASVVVQPTDPVQAGRGRRVVVGVLKGAEYGFDLFRKGWKGLYDTWRRLRKEGRV